MFRKQRVSILIGSLLSLLALQISVQAMVQTRIRPPSKNDIEKIGIDPIQEASYALARAYYLLQRNYCGPSSYFVDNSGKKFDFKVLECNEGHLDEEILDNLYSRYTKNMLIQINDLLNSYRAYDFNKLMGFIKKYKYLIRYTHINNLDKEQDFALKYTKIVHNTIDQFVNDIRGEDFHTHLEIKNSGKQDNSTPLIQSLPSTYGFKVIPIVNAGTPHLIVYDVEPNTDAWRQDTSIGDEIKKISTRGSFGQHEDLFNIQSQSHHNLYQAENTAEQISMATNPLLSFAVTLSKRTTPNRGFIAKSYIEKYFFTQRISEGDLNKLPSYKLRDFYPIANQNQDLNFPPILSLSESSKPPLPPSKKAYMYVNFHTFKNGYGNSNQDIFAIGKAFNKILEFLVTQKQISNLVIDFRNNTGGSSADLMLSLAPFAQQSFQQVFPTKAIKNPSPAFLFNKNQRSFSYLNSKGVMYQLVESIPDLSHWKGKIAILMSSFSTSAAEFFPQILKEVWLGSAQSLRIIGESTKGVGNTAVYPYAIDLADKSQDTLLELNITVSAPFIEIGDNIKRKFFTRQSLIPDQEVKFLSNLFQGDVALGKALEFFADPQ